MADDTTPKPTVASPSFMMGYDKAAGGPKMKSDMKEAEGISDKMRPGAPKDGEPDAAPGGAGGGLGEFLFQFLKANPDIAREMSTRMNAVINGQKIQGMKGAAPGGPPGQTPQSMGAPPAQPDAAPPTQMAGDVLPMPGERSMGGGETPNAAGFATGQQQAPNVQSIGTPTLQQWLANVKARQG